MILRLSAPPLPHRPVLKLLTQADAAEVGLNLKVLSHPFKHRMSLEGTIVPGELSIDVRLMIIFRKLLTVHFLIISIVYSDLQSSTFAANSIPVVLEIETQSHLYGVSKI